MTGQPPRRPTGSYWPQAGIAVGVLFNLAGLLSNRPDLIGTGANILTVSGLFNVADALEKLL
ncbi:MAG: hypothetical protein ACRDK7_11955 [Solirubrobacteraceae bacterium]